jgi:hypothetical protein
MTSIARRHLSNDRLPATRRPSVLSQHRTNEPVAALARAVSNGVGRELRDSAILPIAPAHDIGIPTLPPLSGTRIKLVPTSVPSTEVTLCIYAWHNVQPGLLSWTFPSMDAALKAVQAMRNAVGWAVVRGSRGGTVTSFDLDRSRRRGELLAESTVPS